VENLIPNTIQTDLPINPAILEVEKIVIIVSYSKEYSEFRYSSYPSHRLYEYSIDADLSAGGFGGGWGGGCCGCGWGGW
jgi:hypothetical protein